MIQDHLVCSMNNDLIQHWLLLETELGLKKLWSWRWEWRPQQKMLVSCKIQDVQQNHSCRRTFCKVQSGISDNCYRSGRQNHKSTQCPFRTAKCHNCGKVGHVRKVCRQPKRPPTQGRQTQRHWWRQCKKESRTLEVDLKLYGKPLCMEVNTGATRSLVSEKTADLPFKISVKICHRNSHHSKNC